MLDTGTTEGERLCALLLKRLVGAASWSLLTSEMGFTSTAGEWTRSFQEILAVNLTGRIVAAGQTLHEESTFAGSDFEVPFATFLREMLTIPPRDFPELVRFSQRAVWASLKGLSDGQARRFKEKAAFESARCYMCGVPLLFEEPVPHGEGHAKYTLDHIWPQSYGGDSVEENLLPACSDCNNTKKHGFATWAMTDFHSLNLGLRPSTNALSKISGHHRFALHYRVAQSRAKQRRWTLKQSFQSIGPWTTISLIDGDDNGHFFNLRNHQS